MLPLALDMLAVQSFFSAQRDRVRKVYYRREGVIPVYTLKRLILLLAPVAIFAMTAAPRLRS